MLEPDTQSVILGGRLAEPRTRIFNFFAVDQGARQERQARAHILLVGGVQVQRISYIDGHGHARIAQGEGLALRFANFGPLILRVGDPIGELDKQER